MPLNLNQPTEKLAALWNALNRWEWPDEISDLKPVDESKDEEAGWKIMCAIEDKIDFRECLRWHHIHNLGSTSEEFDRWWSQPKNRQKL